MVMQRIIRLSPEGFDFLLSLVNEDITGQPGFRLPVPADMKLSVTLRYLATKVQLNFWHHCLKAFSMTSLSILFNLNLKYCINNYSQQTTSQRRNNYIIIMWLHEMLSLAATLLPHEYFPTCWNGKPAIIAAYCMQKLHAIIAHETKYKYIFPLGAV